MTRRPSILMSPENYPDSAQGRSQYSSQISQFRFDADVSFQFVEQVRAESGGGVDKIFRTRGWLRLRIGALFALVFSSVCFLFAEPRHVGAVVGSISFVGATIAFLASGFVREIKIRKRERTISTSRTFFGISFEERTYSTDRAEVATRTWGGGGRWGISGIRLFYTIRIGTTEFLLILAEEIGVSEKELPKFKSWLGMT